MLRKIGLTNFKCWRELDIDLAPITLLFGTNSSGKTAILQSLLLLKQTTDSFDPGQHLDFGGGPRDYFDFGSYEDLVFGHDQHKNLGIRMHWNTSTTIFFVTMAIENHDRTLESVEYEVTWSFDDQIFVDKLGYTVHSKEAESESFRIWREEDGSHQMTTSFSHPDQEPERIEAPESCYRVPWTAQYGNENGERISILNLNGEFERIIGKLRYIGPLRLPPQRNYPRTGGKPEVVEPNGENTIQALIASTRDNSRLESNVSRVLQEIGLVEHFCLKPIDKKERLYEVVVTIGGVESSLADTGFGVSQILPVITMLLTAPMFSIVLLEQPELHLHPNAQSLLADFLLFVAEHRQLQLIVESHSEHLLRRLQRRVAEQHPTFARPENIKMYFCEPGPNGSTIDEVEIDKYGQIVNWPDRFLGDISGDIHSMAKAAITRRGQELANVGNRD